MDQSRRVLEEYYNDSNESYACPSWAPTVGFIGIACAVCFASKYLGSVGLGRRLRSRSLKFVGSVVVV